MLASAAVTVDDAARGPDPLPSTEDFGPPQASPHVVLVGASAGGLEALSSLFKAAPEGTGMAFVVVQHLSPDHQSMMAELLSRQTSLSVEEATDNVEPQADTVYVMQPQTGLRMEGGRLRTYPASRDRPPLPINSLFESAAVDLGPRCAGVILSGTGSDGANGLIAIKDHGGTVVIQDPATARFDGMPQAALRTGVADMVLPPERIILELGSLLQDGPALYFGLGSDHGAVILNRILSALRHHTSVDFGHYKPSTVVRRVQRRMDQTGIDDPRTYAEMLKADPAESQSLYRDLLIGVTRFLRDPGAIDAIQKIAIPRLQAMPGTGPLRIWVPGCSTGEEPYSIAMLIAHAFEEAAINRDFRIFATDIDAHALDLASRGEFPTDIRTTLPEELLARYFVRHRDMYVVRQELRDRLLFSRHNVIEDPPFSRLEMVSCRNLLIYLKPPIQDRVLRLLSMSLVDEGILWLGSSETVGHLEDQFVTLDARWRVYSARAGRRRQPIVPTGRSALSHRTVRPDHGSSDRLRGLRAVEKTLLGFAPPTLIVDSQMGLIYRFGRTEDLLHFPEGPVSLDVRSLLPANLSALVVTGVQRAREREVDVVFRSIAYETPAGEKKTVELRIRHVPEEDGQTECFALIFEGLMGEAAPSTVVPSTEIPADLRGRLDDTERELREARENLQTTIEELESANEELQSMNEELVASNEELQSTNEELQSVNEELHTVNMEHEQKVEQLMNLTEDLDNILSSVETGVLVLDSELRLRRFNDPSTRYFSLLSQDIGRPLAHLTHTLTYRRLLDDAAEVVRTAQPINVHCETRDGQMARVKIRPHRHSGERVGGIVVTVTDVTDVGVAARQLQGVLQNLERGRTSLVVVDVAGEIIASTTGFARAIERDEAWIPGHNLRDFVDPVDRDRLSAGLARARAGSGWRGCLRGRRPDDSPTWELVDLVPLGPEHDRFLRVGMEVASISSRLIDVPGAADGREFFAWDPDRVVLGATRGLADRLGPAEAEAVTWTPVDRPRFEAEVENCFAEGGVLRGVWPFETPGSITRLELFAAPLTTAAGLRRLVGEAVLKDGDGR
jgi:two-component system CheB/CheR fusion protein